MKIHLHLKHDDENHLKYFQTLSKCKVNKGFTIKVNLGPNGFTCLILKRGSGQSECVALHLVLDPGSCGWWAGALTILKRAMATTKTYTYSLNTGSPNNNSNLRRNKICVVVNVWVGLISRLVMAGCKKGSLKII